MSKVVLLEKITKIPLFSGLPEQDRDAFIKGGHIRHCPRDQMLFAHGELVKYFYIVVDGTIQLFRENADGHEKTIAILKVGQTMCEDEILDACKTHRANATAVEDSTLMEFPASWLRESAKKQSTLAFNLLNLIAEHVHEAEVEAEHQASMSATQLVVCFLQRLCMLYEFDPNGFDLPYSKTLIASRLGMELETLSRAFSKLREHGITVSGSWVKIHDTDRSRQHACSSCSIAEDCPTHRALQKKMRKSQTTA